MNRFSRVVILLLAIAVFGPPAFASFELPHAVYRMDQLEEALDAARGNDVPLTFLYTNENTDCPLATAASLDAIDLLKDVTVIVYVGSGQSQDWNRTPSVVKRAINSAEAGRYIPIAVVIDADLNAVRSIVPYVRDVTDRRSNLREVRSAIRR